ncbi:MAG TPA: universal stress protein [Gemmatimonadaceae bacterium]|nr:universal stress protein [Gemmatimonadaceae bacterium]
MPLSPSSSIPIPTVRMRLDRVVVALDLAPPSRAAAEWTARHLAPDAELILVHAIDVPEPPVFAGVSVEAHQQLLENAQRGAEVRIREFSVGLPAARIWPEIRVGPALDVVLSTAEAFGASLIVVGPHGAHTGMSRMFGSTADRVVRLAHVPVLVARNLQPQQPRTLLVPLDDSALAPHVLAWANTIAERSGASIALLHVANPLLAGAAVVASAPPEADDALTQLQLAALEWLEGHASRLRAAGRVVRTLVAFGDPATEIEAYAQREHADLVVLGRHGAGRLQRSLLGSTVDHVLRSGTAPTFVIPGTA